MFKICRFFIFYFVLFVFISGCAHPGALIEPISAPPKAPNLKNVRVALVLSGGGARSVAHAGVLEVLNQHNIPIDLIVGSSAGSVIGALYADDPNAQHLKQKIIQLKKKDLMDINWFSGFKMLFWYPEGPIQGNALKSFLNKSLRAKHFSDLKIPLAVVTTDLYHGQPFVIQSGEIIPALHASSALPLIFKPVRLYGRTLVDGGIVSPIPVEIAKAFNPKVIIAVDIGTTPANLPTTSMYQLAMRSLHISYYHQAKLQKTLSDVNIHPAVDEFSIFDDTNNEKLYNAGKQAALNNIAEIKLKLKKANIH